MIKTKNPGIRRAIEELKYFSLNPHLKLRFEAYLKEKRDQKAIEEYARDEAIAKGSALGVLIMDNIEQGTDRSQIIQKIVRYFSLSEKDAEKYYDKFLKTNNRQA